MKKSLSLFIFLLLLPLTLIIVLMVSNIAIKSIRYFVDRQQYGKSYTNIRIDKETEKQLRNEKNAEKRIKIYREHLQSLGRFASWPSIRNFAEEWSVRAARFDNWSKNRGSVGQKQQQQQQKRRRNMEKKPELFEGVWFVRTKQNPRRNVLFFLHGGATFAGSPYKHNNMHWLETIAWLGGMDDRYTDVCSIDYRLQPEHTIRDSLHDCLNEMTRVLETYGQVNDVHLVGFSAGGMLALQCAMLIETVAKNKRTKLFGFNETEKLEKMNDSWRKVTGVKRLFLISPLCRLDRLFLNDRYDASLLLTTFSNAFFAQDMETYDPMYNMIKHRLALDSFDRITIVDVCRNSLSNHAIQLDQTIRKTRSKTRANTILLNELDLLIDLKLARRIYEYEIQQGLKKHKYVEHIANSWMNELNDRLAHFVDYHFFMYIVPANASWKVLDTILTS